MKIERKDAADLIRFLQMDLTELIINTGCIENSEQYWIGVHKQVNEICEKFNNNNLIAKILNAYLEYLEELSEEIYGKR